MSTLEVRATHARNSIWALFFTLGVLAMAWVPRIPEIKHSLGINNGQFGLLLLTSSTASIFGTQFVGRLVHRFGSKSILRFVTIGLPVGVALISRSTHSVIAMGFSLFFMAFNLVSMDLSINAVSYTHLTLPTKRIV